jgi:uncharacterized cofD-like protein
MMEQYSGDFLAAVDGLRGLLGCRGRVWPVSIERASICAEYQDGSLTRGEVEVDAEQSRGHQVKRLWLEPDVSIHPEVADAIRKFDAVIIGPGSFFTSLMPPVLVRGVKEALADVRGPIILIANLLTEGRGMSGFTAGDAARWIADAIGRPVDVIIANGDGLSPEALARYSVEHKAPLEIGDLEPSCQLVVGQFWRKDIARHHRRRLSFAVWSVLSERLLRVERDSPRAQTTVR